MSRTVFTDKGLGIELNIGLCKLAGGSYQNYQNLLRANEFSVFTSTAQVFEKKQWEIRKFGAKKLSTSLLWDARRVSRADFENVDYYDTWQRVEQSSGRQSLDLSRHNHDFLTQLDDDYPIDRCCSKAKLYREDFEANKEHLVQDLKNLFNKKVFGGLLQNVDVVWNSSIVEAWGSCTEDVDTVGNRISEIELNPDLCSAPFHVRDVLIHEMCHAAVWLISMLSDDDHGPLWRFWTEVAMRIFPSLPLIAETR